MHIIEMHQLRLEKEQNRQLEAANAALAAANVKLETTNAKLADTNTLTIVCVRDLLVAVAGAVVSLPARPARGSRCARAWI